MARSTSGPSTIPGSILRRGALFALLWWILSEGRADSWLLGSVAIAAGLWMSFRMAPPAPAALRIGAVPRFLAFFVLASIKGGAQVAFAALRRRAVFRPLMIELPLSLPPGAARTLMTASLSLMPGTVAVRLEGDALHIHVLDDRLPALAGARALEHHIAQLYGVAT